jgi:hypothetical protein
MSFEKKSKNRAHNATPKKGTNDIKVKRKALKVLSSEMDPAEIRFIRKIFIKERGAEIFRKIRTYHIL